MIVVLAGVTAMLIGTWFGMPTVTPIVVGAAIGLAWPRFAARQAALAGSLAWGGLLLVALMRGDDVGSLSATLGGAMGIPSWALLVATLLYPAVLASSAAWLAHLASPRRSRSIDREPARARSSS